MNYKTIKQTVSFDALPKEIYAILMDSEKHSEVTGSPAKIKAIEGGKFTAWDGYIDGENIELIEDKKIVQKWKAQEEKWPENHFSTVTIILREKDGGTELNFEQTEVPEEVLEDIKQGWEDFYWDLIKEWLKENR